MQDQGKRLLIAVALALGVMFAWQMIFPPKKPDQPPPTPIAGSAAPAPAHSRVGVADETPPAQPAVGAATGSATGSAGSATAAGSATTAGTAAPVPAVAPIQPRGPEQTLELKGPKIIATFSSYGGVLKAWKLTDSRYEHDATKGELLTNREDKGAFHLGFTSDSTFKLPARTEWVGVQKSDHEVEYTYASPPFHIVKTFTIVPEAYIVRVAIKVELSVPEGTEAHETLALTSYEFQDPKLAGGGSSRIQPREWDSATLRDGSILSTPITSLLDPQGGPRFEPKIQWTGWEHPYLLVAFAPNPAGGNLEKHTYADSTGLMTTDMLFTPGTAFKHGDPGITREIVGYLGPKNLHQLENADTAAGFATGFSATLDLGWFGFIGRPLLWLLLKFHEIVGNWGVAIILLTLLVKGATLYWTTKSMRSMKTMAVLGPQLKGLQERYKDDKPRLQVETMALYKQYGVNPLLGCLPILLQMPIWLALYRMLSSAGELYQQPFIPGWINDLTTADPLYILPIILVVTMFAQARLTPQSVDPAQKMQQRMMQYGMPLVFGAMSFVFPSGLTLYIFTNTCLSALHSIYMNKFDKKSLEMAAMLKKNQAGVVAVVPKDAKAAAVKAAKPSTADIIANAKDDDEADDDDEPAAVAVARNTSRGPARQKRRKKARGR